MRFGRGATAPQPRRGRCSPQAETINPAGRAKTKMPVPSGAGILVLKALAGENLPVRQNACVLDEAQQRRSPAGVVAAHRLKRSILPGAPKPKCLSRQGRAFLVLKALAGENLPVRQNACVLDEAQQRRSPAGVVAAHRLKRSILPGAPKPKCQVLPNGSTQLTGDGHLSLHD